MAEGASQRFSSEPAHTFLSSRDLGTIVLRRRALKFTVQQEELLPERTISCLTRSILLNWYESFDTIP
jgi:hypothetical protein